MLKKVDKIKERHKTNAFFSLLKELFIRVYEKECFRVVLRYCFSAKKPKSFIFVYGCYNAGTTIIKEAISIGEKYASLPIEGDQLTSFLPDFEMREWPRGLYGNVIAVNQYRKEEVVDSSMVLREWSPWIGAGRPFVEKSIANSVKIKQMHLAFPNYKSIVVIRRPEAVVGGILKRSRPGRKAALFLGRESYSVEFLLRQWMYIYSCILEDCEGDANVVFVNYEDFLSDPIRVTTYLKRHLGADSKGVRYEDDKLSCAGDFVEVKVGVNDVSSFESEHASIDKCLMREVDDLYTRMQSMVNYGL